jgi:mRNA-degrading endonuclease RelE of RelBE toxin-antitoxin system
MATQLYLSNTADKVQRKLDKPLRLVIKQALIDIMQAPATQGEKLSQPLTEVYSHHVKYKGKEYRIAYQYNADEDCVFIVLIGPHENFYKRVKNMVYAS